MRNIFPQSDSSPASETSANSDPRVAHALRSAGCNHQLMPSGDYIMGFELKRDRRHAVHVNSRTAQVGLREMRCLFACAYASEDSIPADVMAELLTANATHYLGAWEIRSDDGMGFVIFAASISADASAVELLTAALHVAQIADDLEEGLTADDRF